MRNRNETHRTRISLPLTDRPAYQTDQLVEQTMENNLSKFKLENDD